MTWQYLFNTFKNKVGRERRSTLLLLRNGERLRVGVDKHLITAPKQRTAENGAQAGSLLIVPKQRKAQSGVQTRK